VIRAHPFEQIERDIRLIGEANAVAQVVLDGRGVLRTGTGCDEYDE